MTSRSVVKSRTRVANDGHKYQAELSALHIKGQVCEARASSPLNSIAPLPSVEQVVRRSILRFLHEWPDPLIRMVAPHVIPTKIIDLSKVIDRYVLYASDKADHRPTSLKSEALHS
jgi:hypothetical protein